jgi:hypothetical protein
MARNHTNPAGYYLFDQAFVDTNRMGRITPEQQAFLEGQLTLVPSILGTGCQAILLLFVLGVISLIVFIWLATWETALPVKIGLGVLAAFILLAIIGRAVLNHSRKRSRLQADLAQGSVRRVEGSLSFRKGSYQVVAGGQSLFVPTFARQDSLAPGLSYTFYYLPNSGTILSAEKKSILAEHQAREELNKILADANKFHYPALAINRQGQLADQQVGRVRSRLVAPLLFILLPLGFLGYQLYNQFNTSGRINMNSSFTIMALIALGIAIMGIFTLSKSLADLANRQVISIEGQGYKDKRVRTDSDGHDSTDYYYVIGDQRFQVKSSAYRALVDGLQYRAYYTPGGKTLVNIESLEAPGESG